NIDNAHPLSPPMLHIDQTSAENRCRRLRCEIDVIPEVSRLPFSPRAPAVEDRVWRLVFCGGYQGYVECNAGFPCRKQLFGGEIIDSDYLKGLVDIAEIRSRKFIAGWPCREHASLPVSVFKKSFSPFVQADVVAISQIVLGRKPVRRIHKQRRNER